MTDALAAADRPMSRRAFLQAASIGGAGIAAWSVLGGVASAAAPQRGPAAHSVDFNSGWLFGGEVTPGCDDPAFDDSNYATVTLPHTVTALSWREWQPAGWEQEWSYRKHFRLPPEFAGTRVFLDFGAAMTSMTPTVNGHRLPTQVGGFRSFSLEVTDQLAAGTNILAVALDARFTLDVPPDRPAPNDSTTVDFWQPGGVYRDVRLRAVPQLFLADVFAKPIDVLDPRSRRVEVTCTVDAAAVPAAGTRIVVELRHGGTRVAGGSVPVTVDKVGQTTASVTLDGLSGVQLWDIDDPRLYDVVAILQVGGQSLHDYRTRIGFRQARFALEGFFLNGQRRKLFGLNRHQLFPYTGGAMPARGQRRDAEILRDELNCNMVRCSHYPQSEDFLDACDELGLMVWEEAPGWGYLGDDAWKALAYRDVGEMIRRDRNRPSVIIWGARLNETDDDVPFYTSTQNLAHSLDDSRPTVGAMAGRHDTTAYVQDVFSQNDYSSRTGADGAKQPELLPPRTDRPYLVSEAVGTLSGPAVYFRRTDPQAVQQGQATAHARVHDLGAADDRYCGILPWSGFDYPSGNGNQFQGVKYTGVVDLFRELKPGAAIYQAQVDPKIRPVIAPAFYWDFGPTSPVTGLSAAMICANVERLEIYVGGAHFGTAHPDTTGYGHLAYPPSFVDFSAVDGSGNPELRIDGYLGSARVTSRSFAADPSGDRLSVAADDAELVGDGVDATRIAFRAVDRHGAPRPYVDGQVSFTVDGPAILIGDNPFPAGDTGGVGAVWLRTIRNSPGTVVVHAKHSTLGGSVVRLRVRPPTPGGPPEPYGSVAVSAAPALVAPGGSTTVTVTVTDIGTPDLEAVVVALELPAGVTATPISATTFSRLRSGRSVQARWRLTVPAGTEPGTLHLGARASYHAGAQRGVTKAATDVLVPAPSLAAAYNNAAISDDADVDTADIDGVGNSYSGEALTAAGLARGATVTHDGIAFTWPDLPPGTPDNLLAGGETVAVDGSGSHLGLLGASSGGSHGGNGTVHYTDGTSSPFAVTLDDYFFAPTDNTTIASMPYINSQGIGGRPRGQRQQTVYIFYAAVSVTAGKQVAAVTLPTTAVVAAGRISGMHIFALGLG